MPRRANILNAGRRLCRVFLGATVVLWSQSAPGVSATIQASETIIIPGQPVQLGAEGLAPGTATLHVFSAIVNRRPSHAWAEFQVEGGRVDTATQTPLRGSYTGVDPAGLFWSLRNPRSQQELDQLAVLDPVFSQSAYHIVLSQDSMVLDSMTIRLDRAPSGVGFQRVSEGNLRGVLALPRGGAAAARGGVLIIGGSPESEEHFLPQQIARSGYVVLQMHYHHLSRKRGFLDHVPVAHFRRGLEYLRAQAGKPSLPIVVLGVSRGAEAAVLLAASGADVQGLISIAGSDFIVPSRLDCLNFSEPWSLPQDLPETLRVPCDVGVSNFFDTAFGGSDDGSQRRALSRIIEGVGDPSPYLLPYERIPVPILLIAGELDEYGPMADGIRRTCARQSCEYGARIQAHIFPDAGHAIFGDGWLPFDCVFDDGVPGPGPKRTCEADAKAQQETFRLTLEFLDSLMPSRNHETSAPSLMQGDRTGKGGSP